MTDTKNNNIKWNTTIRNVPDDVSYNTIYSRLNNYQNYSDEFFFNKENTSDQNTKITSKNLNANSDFSR